MRRRDVRGPGEEQRACHRSDLCCPHSSALYMWVVGCSPWWRTGWRFLTCKRVVDGNPPGLSSWPWRGSGGEG